MHELMRPRTNVSPDNLSVNSRSTWPRNSICRHLSPPCKYMTSTYIFPLMPDPRSANLLGAAVTALNDELEAATASGAEHGAAFPAALVSVHWAPGLSIEQLRRILGLSHSGTVRLLDRLE